MYRAIIQIQSSCDFICCIQCTLSYPTKWYNMKLNRCFFCTLCLKDRAWTLHSSYHDLLKEMEWQFIKSGESDRREYDQDYLRQMKKWCRHYHIEPTEEDKQMEKDIQHTWEIY